MTYRELYLKYRDIAYKQNKEETAVKLLIQELSGFSSTDFYLQYDEVIKEEQLNKIYFALNEYLNNDVPVQYVLGYTYFYGIKFMVNKNVLIPRRETEELVDWVIKNNPFENPIVLDIGTGSGAIAISLKSNLLNSKVTAVDISRKALNVAIQNAKLNKQEIDFIESDVFSNVEGRFNIIVANPPYIDKEDDVDELVLKNEPHLALFAKQEGLYFYDKILKQSIKFLEEKSLIVFEIPEDKDEQLLNIVDLYYVNSHKEIKKDLQGKSRILIIKNNWR